MFRSPWFWIAVVLITVGVLLTATLGVLYWLVGAFVIALLVVVVIFVVAAYAVGRVELSEAPHLEKVAYSERIPTIYDCDVTMGRLFREVSDGLALLYLLGEPRVHLVGITTTYGNGSVGVTTSVARSLLDALQYDGIEVTPGVDGPDEDPQENQAARFLVETVAKRPGEIALVATGSLSNLKHAAALDPDFFQKLRGLYVYGGVTGPLAWHEHQLAELNFSADPEAAYQVLRAACPVTVIPRQAGLTAIFRSPQFAALQTLRNPVSRLIARRIRSWFALTRLYFQDGGFGMWASLAPVALTRVELLETEQVYVTSTRVDLQTGHLAVNPDGSGPVRIVRGVLDFDEFVMAQLAAWQYLGQLLEIRRKH